MKLSLALFVLLSCLSAFAITPITDDKLNELLQSFQYTPEVNVTVKPKVSCSAQSLKYTTTYPQRETPLEIEARTYIPDSAAAVPLIILLPPLGGTNPLDTGTAEALCRNGLATFIITTDLTGLDQDPIVPVSDHDQTGRRVASAVKAAMLIARTYPEINADKVGMLGASLGGILGSIAYSVIPEISAATFIVNGGDVPYILAHSDQPKVINLKNKRMREQNLKTNDEYEAFLNANMTLDPLYFAKLIPRESVKLYLSKNDASVPSSRQMAYYEALGKPAETRFYNTSHPITIFSVMGGLSSEKQKIANWFKERFALPNPRKP